MPRVPAKSESGRNDTSLILFAVAHALAFLSVLWLAVYRNPAFRVEIFRGYADRIFSGQIPFAAFSYEYPPLSLFVLLIPRLFTSDPEAYGVPLGARCSSSRG